MRKKTKWTQQKNKTVIEKKAPTHTWILLPWKEKDNVYAIANKRIICDRYLLKKKKEANKHSASYTRLTSIHTVCKHELYETKYTHIHVKRK
jgi:hypothetical protein